MAEKGFKWYAMRSVTGKEAKLKEYIEKECEHNEQLRSHVSQVLLPMEILLFVLLLIQIIKIKLALRI